MQPDLRKQLLQQAAMVKQLRKLNRKAPYRRSKLEAHRDSITLLHQAGYSTRDITFWLCLELHQKVHHSTVARALTRWAKDG